MARTGERRSRERLAQPMGLENPHIFVQGGWERMVLEVSQASFQALNYGGPLAAELERFRAEGWKITYTLDNTEGKTLYFKRALPRAPRRLKETLMW
ncbi:MAG: hypothetical protein WCS37_05095 [Chloroflexota bacterium]|nr:hypothetical protein [Chloroflexota bacterium]